MSLPSREEIREKAIELFHIDQQRKGLPLITPTDEELREGNYWLGARNELMRGYEGELEKTLAMYEEEARNLRELLGVPVTDEAKMTELEGKVADLESRLGRTRDQLKKTKEEVTRLEAEIAKAKAKPPTAPLKEEELPLEEEDVKRLYGDLHYLLTRAKVPNPEMYDAELKIDRRKSYTENFETVRKLAEDIIKRLKRELPAPPTPELEARVKRIEEIVERVTAPPRELPPREAIYETVIDWYDLQTLVTVDRDEIWRLRQLLHYDEHFYYLSPEHQRQIYGVDIRGAVKLAIFNERITRNHIADMGLNPEAYGV